jgi:hypothetical protein
MGLSLSHYKRELLTPKLRKYSVWLARNPNLSLKLFKTSLKPLEFITIFCNYVQNFLARSYTTYCF